MNKGVSPTYRRVRVIHSLSVLASFFLFTLMAMAQLINPSDTAERLHALFEEDWQWTMEQSPEYATLLGDHRYNDRLTDLSFEAIERRKAHEREMLERIQKIQRSELSGQDLISYDLFLRDKRLNVKAQRWPTEYMPITQMGGAQLSFPRLIASTPFRDLKDYQNYLARLAAFPRYIDQVIALMRRGIETKWVQAAVPLRSVPSQVEGQILEDLGKSPLYRPFKEFPKGVSRAEHAQLAEAGRRQIAGAVIPALRELLTFVKDTYLPAARKDIGARSLPDGEAYYQYAIRRMTTTPLTAQEIHEIGQREVVRIRKEMEEIIGKVGFKGTFQEFLTFLRTDSRFYYTKPEDLVMGYRDIVKRADGELPRLFAELPRNPYGVKEIPAHEAPAQTTAYYQPGAADGSHAGFVYVNTYKLETRPKYEMEALMLHEAVPGHHLQISRAQELKGLPDFRRNASYTAYLEGWGLYAEGLGEEMGFYTDPYSKFGRLTYEMWRACRLVVDTGMHALGWSRQQAIDFLKENTAKSENDIIVEVDRYIVWPAQALAYKMGELKLRGLRAKAERELGNHFDIRRFHNALLDDGPLPLDLLEERIDDWMAEQRGKR
jgi:uncharacterized protein (DUF885 family)